MSAAANTMSRAADLLSARIYCLSDDANAVSASAHVLSTKWHGHHLSGSGDTMCERPHGLPCERHDMSGHGDGVPANNHAMPTVNHAMPCGRHALQRQRRGHTMSAADNALSTSLNTVSG